MPNDPDLLIGGEDPIITREVREAVFLFDSQVKAEKEMSDAAILLSHMRDYALARVFLMLVEGGHTPQDMVQFLERASQSLKNQRQQQTGNPVRVFRRAHVP